MKNSSQKRRRKTKLYTKVFAYIVGGAFLVTCGWAIGAETKQAPIAKLSSNIKSSTLVQEKVLAVGGSMAYGWKDPTDNSYLRRAFQSLTNTTNTTYIYDDHTKVGASPVQFDQSGTFTQWITADKPQIVAISWGLLNDVSKKTPMDQFDKAIKDEISASLKAHAVVLIITSPVVKATADTNHKAVEQYISHEVADAKSFHSANVHFINLNTDMTNYLAAHGQTWQDYYGDNWHPDAAGHQLAGELLTNDLIKEFGTGPIQFKNRLKSVISTMKS